MRIIPSLEMNGRILSCVPTSRNSTVCVAAVSVTVVVTYPNSWPIWTSARCLFRHITFGDATTLVSPTDSNASRSMLRLLSRKPIFSPPVRLSGGSMFTRLSGGVPDMMRMLFLLRSNSKFTPILLLSSRFTVRMTASMAT